MIVQQKQKLAEGTHLLKIKAPGITKQIHPGQYICLRKDKDGPRLHAYPTSTEGGVLSFVFTEDGPCGELTKLKKGEEISVCCGPLGKPFAINEYGNVVIVADGDGIGASLPLGKALKAAGNRVYFIGRYPSKKAKFWEGKLSDSFDKWALVIKREDNNDPLLKEFNSLLRRKHVKLALAMCDLATMPILTHLTELRSSLYCSLLGLVTDGPGLCTQCRVSLGGDTKLPCVDGPLVNAHRINWDEIIARHILIPPVPLIH